MQPHHWPLLMLLLLGLAGQAHGQGKDTFVLRPAVEKIVQQMARDSMYKSAAIGPAGQRPQQWSRYQQLSKQARDKELIALTNHVSPPVRCYAFQALAERHHPAIIEILRQHLTDTARVETFQGCIVSERYVGDFFLDVVTPAHISDNVYKLSASERQEIDSLLLYRPHIRLQAQADVLQGMEPRETYYDRIRELYTQENKLSALVALSKYERPADKPLIKKALQHRSKQYYGLRSVIQYPDSAFFPWVRQIHQQQLQHLSKYQPPLTRVLYGTIVQYKTPQSRQLLEKTIRKTNGQAYHAEPMWIALTKFPDPVYDGLKQQLHLSDRQKRTVSYWRDRPIR